MPAWTLGDVISNVTRRMGNRDDISESDCSFWANVAYEEIASQFDHTELERIAFTSITSGQSRIVKPANMKEVINLSHMTTGTGAISSAMTLRPIGIDEVDSQTIFPSAKPEAFYEYRDWIGLFPSPNSAFSIQIRYRSNMTDLLELTQTPSISTPWRVSWMYLTETYLNELVGNEIEATQAYAKYLSRVQTLEQEYDRQLGQRGPRRISMPQRKPRY